MTSHLDTRPNPIFDWFIPIDGDGNHIGTSEPERMPTFDYLRRVVDTAEKCGFHSMLIPTRFANGLFDEKSPLAETWTTVTALAAVTNKIRFLVAVRPGFISVGLFAQMVATLDQISRGRIDLNIVPGGIKGDFERLGETSDHSTRYLKAEEFIVACKKLWEYPGPVYFDGKTIQLNGAICSPSPQGSPSFYVGGASDQAINLSARQGDTYLAWILPKDVLSAHLEKSRIRYRSERRKARFGLRTHLIVRDSEEEAWAAAAELLSMAESSVQKQRMKVNSNTNLEKKTPLVIQPRDYKIGSHLWTGISTVWVNCGTALVGDTGQVAEELAQYWEIGIDEFILSAYPHVEECERISEGLIPIIEEKISLRRVQK